MMQKSINTCLPSVARPLVGNAHHPKVTTLLNGDIEYQINVSDLALEHFGKDFFMLEPELLNNIAKS
jgi:hypothetical protein